MEGGEVILGVNIEMNGILNKFREIHGRQRVYNWDNVVSHFCYEHCCAMADRGDLFHAPDVFLNGWGEAVAFCSIGDSIFDAKNHIVYRTFSESESHRNLILNSSTLACAWVVRDGRLYVTVRGR